MGAARPRDGEASRGGAPTRARAGSVQALPRGRPSLLRPGRGAHSGCRGRAGRRTARRGERRGGRRSRVVRNEGRDRARAVREPRRIRASSAVTQRASRVICDSARRSIWRTRSRHTPKNRAMSRIVAARPSSPAHGGRGGCALVRRAAPRARAPEGDAGSGACRGARARPGPLASNVRSDGGDRAGEHLGAEIALLEEARRVAVDERPRVATPGRRAAVRRRASRSGIARSESARSSVGTVAARRDQSAERGASSAGGGRWPIFAATSRHGSWQRDRMR